MIGLLVWGVSTIAKLTCTYTILTVKISERGGPELAQHYYHYQFHLSDLVRLYINNLPYSTLPAFSDRTAAPLHRSIAPPLRPTLTAAAMSTDKPLPFIYQFAAGAVAGVSEILVMYPLDVVKTRV